VGPEDLARAAVGERDLEERAAQRSRGRARVAERRLEQLARRVFLVLVALGPGVVERV
jgi:hypothetical protein